MESEQYTRVHRDMLKPGQRDVMVVGDRVAEDPIYIDGKILSYASSNSAKFQSFLDVDTPRIFRIKTF